MTKGNLTGYAIITGAASGIGKETAFALAEAGAKGVLFADIQEKVSDVAEESKSFATCPEFMALNYVVDVTKKDAVKGLVDFAKAKFGRIDYLVNSAGIDPAAVVPFTETSDEDFDRIFQVNARGTFLVSKAVAQVMATQEAEVITTRRFGQRTLSRGSIVNVASLMAWGATPGKTAYITAKHALLGLTRASALDLNKVNIRVNMVSPTWVNTPLLDEDRKKIPQLDHIINKFLPIGRAAEADEVASAILYLCGPDSTYVTGANIMIDNGMSVGPSL